MLVVVPCDIDASNFLSQPIGGDFVGLLEGLEEVFGMVVANVLDSKVIHDEHKNDGSPFVVPEARHSGALVVAVGGKSFGEEVIGQFASLFEAIDAFCDLEVNPVVEGILGEIVLINEFLWDVRYVDADIFWTIERCAQIKVGEVVAGKACLWGRESAIEEELDGFE